MNNIISELIPSKDILDWIINSGHIFSIDEMISLIWNSNKSLSEKLNLFSKLNNKKLLTEYTHKDVSFDIHKIKEIIDNINTIANILYNSNKQFRYVIRLAVSEKGCADTDAIIVGSLNYVSLGDVLTRHYNNEVKLLYGELIDIVSSDVVMNIYFTDKNRLSGYDILDNTEDFIGVQSTKLDSYINIPIPIKAGDVVKVIDESTEYVVIYDNTKPENTKNLDITDSCITVLKRVYLNRERDYKEQIDEILLSRKSRKNKDTLDVISVNHEHIPIINIERITKHEK